MSIFKELDRYGCKFPLIGPKRSYTVTDLRRIKELNAEVCRRLSGKSVVFRGLDSIDIAASVLLLSDVVDSLLILPSNINSVTGDELEKAGGIHYRVSITDGKFECVDLGVTQDCDGKKNGSGFNWLIPTSGTEGTPKLVKHTLHSLAKSVKPKSSGSQEYIWGACYEIGRFAGIQVFLQALYSGSPLCVYDDLSDVDSLISFYIEQRVTSMSATPSFWRKLLSNPASEKLTLGSITLGGEIVDQSILNKCSRLFPEAQIRHIYASTEAGVGFVVSDKMEGFPSTYLANGFGKVEMKISQASTLMLRQSQTAQRYIGDKQLCDKEGFIDSGDVVDVAGDRVYFKGRANGVINVGGNKVHPERVESVILEITAVTLCRVYSKKSPVLGSIVAADVSTDLPKERYKELKNEIVAACKSKLEAYEVPHIVKFFSQIEISENGKILRK